MECVLSLVDEGTVLRALVATTGGDVIGQATEAGPSNARFIGAEGLARRLHDLLARALAPAGDTFCLSAVAALHADPERSRDWLAEIVALDRERVFVSSIERCALAGSLATPLLSRAVVVRADVGSRGWAIAEPGHEVSRGGFGEVLGDEGSAYWIGRQGIRAALKAYEKRFRNTLLKGRLLSHYGISTYQALLTPDHEPTAIDRYAIAGFASQVFEAAAQGDEVAHDILDEAGRDLAAMALALVNDLELVDAPFSVLPSGSVFRMRGPSLEAFMKVLRNKTTKANLVKEGMGPAAGGVLLALAQLGLKVRPETAETLRASLERPQAASQG